MKKLIIALLLTCGVVQAQASEGLNSDGIQALADQLSLNEAQREKVNVLILRYAEQAAALQKESVALRQQMQALPLTELSRDTIKQLSQRAGSVAARHTGAVLQTQLEFYKVLNASQKAEYAELRKQGKAKSNK